MAIGEANPDGGSVKNSSGGNNKIVIPREGNLIGSDEQIATMPDRGDLPLFICGGLRYQPGR